MILKYLSEAQLQNAVGDGLLQRLEALAPLLLGEDADPTRLFRKRSLLKVLSAFGPASRMKDPTFMHELLNALPESVLTRIVEATGVGSPAATFSTKKDALIRRGWNDLDFCQRFVQAAELPESFLPAPPVHLPSIELVAPATIPFKRLKDYQQGVHRAALAALLPPRSRFVVQMPTGSGKTRTAMEIIADVLVGETLPAVKGPRVVVWLAHAEELCEQAIACFREVWSHLGTTPCQVVRWFGTHSTEPASGDGPVLIVAGFQKLHSTLSKSPHLVKSLASVVTLLVIDEAHKVLAPTYMQSAVGLIGKSTRVMGLTATPGRAADNHDANAQLAEFFFGQVVPLPAPPGEAVIPYLRRLGVLSRARMERLATAPNLTLTDAVRRSIERELDYPVGFLSKLGADDVRNVEIVRRLKKLLEEGKRILFFACSVEHSRFVCAVLVYLGFRAAHVDSGTQQSERSAAIGGFRSGSIQVLCNYGILSTGFDAPKTDVVFISRPTKSIVLFSQMVGRGLRGPAIGGTPECLLVNVVDNIVGLPDNESIYDYFEDYWTSAA